MLRRGFVLAFAAWSAAAQTARSGRPKRYPDGRSVDLELARRDHQKSLDQVARIREIAIAVEAEMERDTAHVVSMKTLAKLEQIEELAKSARERLKRTY